MTYSEAVDYLQGLGRFGLRPGLEAIRALSAWCGFPEARLKFLHVAGTNGKGSTCAFLDAICRSAGMKVGLYTSPHLIGFRERIRVNGEPIPEGEVAEWVGRLREASASGGAGWEVPHTFFETVTALALNWFAREGCEIVVWETGLGGRLDATNLVHPEVSVLTNVGWDHMEWLGNSLRAIAAEKAGIIKEGVPVVTTARDEEVIHVFKKVASERGAPLTCVRPDDLEWAEYAALPRSLSGEHQRWNAVLAVAALKAAGLMEGRIDDGAIRRGLANAVWPGRFQVLQAPWDSGRIVLDGAHNGSGFEVLAAGMAETFPGRRYALVLGMLADKDPAGEVRRVVSGASRIVATEVGSSRGLTAEDLKARCERMLGAEAAGVEISVAANVREGLERLRGEALVLVTGSLYLVGEALEYLTGESKNERVLNEWRPNC